MLQLLLILAAAPVFTGEQQNRKVAMNLNVALRVLPGGGGAPAVGDACSYVSATYGTPTVCLSGDGTSHGSTAISAVGSPTSQTQRICGNGPNCWSEKAQRVSGGNYFRTAAVGPPTDFTDCWLGSADSTAPAAQGFVGQDDGAGNRITQLYVSLATPVATVFSANATNSSINGGAVVAGVQHLVCLSYHYVADGTSVGTLYVDGVSVATSSTMHGPPNASASARISAGNVPDGSNPLTGLAYAAFRIPSSLNSTQHTALANLLLGARGPQGIHGSYGEALTFSRTSGWTCPADDGSITQLASGQPCVTQAGVKVRPSVVNKIQFSAAIGTSPWVTQTNVVVTQNDSADCGLAPDGSNTVSLIDLTSAAAATGELQQASVGAIGDTEARQVYLWRRAADSNCNVKLDDPANTLSPPDTGLTATAQLVSTIGSGNSLNPGIWIKKSSTSACNKVCAWDAQMVDNATTTSDVCPTAGASATCGPETLTATAPSTLTNTEGSISADVICGANVPQQYVVTLGYGARNDGLTIVDSNHVQMSDGISGTSAAVTLANATNHIHGAWYGTTIESSANYGAVATATYGGTILGGSTLGFGVQSGGTQGQCVLSNFCFGTSRYACP